jgi:hypothetical protein
MGIQLQMKICCCCKRVKPAVDFYVMPSRNNQLSSNCKDCERANKRIYNRKPRSKLLNKERVRRWQKHNKKWIAKYLKLRRAKLRPKCRLCGTSIPYPSSGRTYCKVACSRLAGKLRQRKYAAKKQQELTAYKVSTGCSICGYKKCASALDFHHLHNKRFRLYAKIWGTVEGNKELKKCVLLCSNCHHEQHEKLRKPT